MNYFFTADEHYGHDNAIMYNNRPFSCTAVMNYEMIKRHNEVVGENDTTVHVGDFCWYKKYEKAIEIIEQLNGKHIFLRGSHDEWMEDHEKKISKDLGFKVFLYQDIWKQKIGKAYMVACHYAFTVWPRSHYGAWLAFGHSHGKLDNPGKCWDVGVDRNNYYPVAWDTIRKIMKVRPQNRNYLPPEQRITNGGRKAGKTG